MLYSIISNSGGWNNENSLSVWREDQRIKLGKAVCPSNLGWYHSHIWGFGWLLADLDDNDLDN